MKVVIDTNSLISLVRYYLPFDKKGVLFKFFKQKIEIGEIIIIDKVYEECLYTSKGIVISTLDYLNDKTFMKTAKVPYKTHSILVPNTKQFFHQLNSVFVNSIMRKKINDVEFDVLKEDFLKSADMKQIILALNIQKERDKVILVTEETESSNDNKLFKKIPALCKELEIETVTLPELLEIFDGIDIDFQ